MAFKEFSGITHSSITELRLKKQRRGAQQHRELRQEDGHQESRSGQQSAADRGTGRLVRPFLRCFIREAAREISFQSRSWRGEQRAADQGWQRWRGTTARSKREELDWELAPASWTTTHFREFLAGMSKWAISDSPTTPRRDTFSDRDRGAYSFRRSDASLSPWGLGPEPADHEFLRRLFAEVGC